MKNKLCIFIILQTFMNLGNAQTTDLQSPDILTTDVASSLATFNGYQLKLPFQLQQTKTKTTFFPPNYDSLKTDFLQQYFEKDGTETGNGGFVRFCESKNSFSAEFEDIVDLDLSQTQPKSTLESVVEEKLSTIALLDKKLYDLLKNSFVFFQQKNISLSSSASLGIYPDYQIAAHLHRKRYMDSDCYLIQLYSRISSANTHQVIHYLLLKPDLFTTLTPQHQAAAVMHEILYDVFLYTSADLTHSTIFDGVMDLNQFIFKLPIDFSARSESEIQSYRAQLQEMLHAFGITL